MTNNVKNILKLFNTTFKKNEDLSKPEICSKLHTTRTYKMTAAERQKMIDKLNKKKPKNPKMVDTFFQINGREPMDEEMMTGLENNILNDNLFNGSMGIPDGGDGSLDLEGSLEGEKENELTLDNTLPSLPELEEDMVVTEDEDEALDNLGEDGENLQMTTDNMDDYNDEKFVNSSSV